MIQYPKLLLFIATGQTGRAQGLAQKAGITIEINIQFDSPECILSSHNVLYILQTWSISSLYIIICKNHQPCQAINSKRLPALPLPAPLAIDEKRMA
jgi:hypothetical protein